MPIESRDSSTLETTAEAFKALGDPIRLHILQLLGERSQTKKLSVSGIAEQLGISQPNVSHHIRTLKTAGFVRCTKKDGCSYYAVRTGRIGELVSFLSPRLAEGVDSPAKGTA